MKILFSHSYFMKFDSKQWNLGQPFPPLGTILAASVLREAGHEVMLFDSQFSDSANEVIPFLDKFKPDVFVICDDGFNYLTKMCLTNMREAAFEMQKLAKAKGSKVIVSSSDATDHFEKYLSEGADFVIKGEVEITLRELIAAINKGESVKAIQGLVFRENEITIQNPKRNVLEDLDQLPRAAWDLIDIEKYKSIWISHHGYFSLNMATTRGCPFKCNWCAKPIYGNRYNSRSPESVVDELVFLKENYHYDHIWFADDIFGLAPGWVNAFAKLVKEKGLKLKYKIQSRADLLLQENYIADLAASGCETAWMGAESGSQKILDAMDKGTTVAQIKESTVMLKKYGIRSAFFLQFGYPGEKMEDIHLTIEMLNELLPDDIGISVSYPLPGTKFYENVKSELKEKQNWSHSNEMALMFKNSFSPVFYKTLHTYVHWNYRKHQGYESFKNFFSHPGKIKKSDFKRAASIIYYIPAVIRQKKRLEKLEHAGN